MAAPTFKMLNLTIAMSNVFNPRRQNVLPRIREPLLLMPAHKLSQMIKSGQLSSERLCRLVAERIKEVQPHINCMCQERFDEAFEEAARIDALLEELRTNSRKKKKQKKKGNPDDAAATEDEDEDDEEDPFTREERELLNSPLLGVPLSVKESIQVKSMRNSCGLWDRRFEYAAEDAVVVANARRFGLIPICTSNVPECTLYWADCQNRVYGQSRNPYDLSRITGASSGGEGGLLGSGASLLGIGSDIGGSLRIPAHYCGVYSHKPSPFLVSSEGNFPALKHARLRMFTLGPMTRYASDLKPLLKCLLQDDEKTNPKKDSYHKHQPADIGKQREALIRRLDEPVDLSKIKLYYFKFNESSELRGKQSVRVQDELARGQQEVLDHFVNKFNCQVEELNLDRYLKKTLITWQCLIRCAGKDDREDAFEDDEIKNQFGIDSLLLEFLKMPFGASKHTKESLLILIVGSAMPSEREKAFALCEKFESFAQELKDEMHQLLGDSGALLMPTLPTVAYKHNVSLMKTPDIRFPAMFNILQLPVTHATIRLDEAHRLPYGVSLAARPFNDHLTLALAEEIEQAFGGWTEPTSAAAAAAAADAGKTPATITSDDDEQKITSNNVAQSSAPSDPPQPQTNGTEQKQTMAPAAAAAVTAN